MPIYSYKCPECGNFDYKQSMSDDALTECPKCNASVKKVFNAPAISGFRTAPAGQNPNRLDAGRSPLWNSAQMD
jgi:putative FmdB family regulatory protein